ERVRDTHATIRIAEVDVVIRIRWRKRSDIRERIVDTRLRRSVVVAGATANSGPAVGGEAISKSDARRNVPPLRTCTGLGTAFVVILTAVDYADRSVGIARGFLPGSEANHAAFAVPIWKEGIPTHSQIQCQVLTHAPVVL